MDSVTKKCSVCGREFIPCNTCGGENELLKWRRVVCCPEHFSFHIILISYIRGITSKEQARQELVQAMERFGAPVLCGQAKTIAEELLNEGGGETIGGV